MPKQIFQRPAPIKQTKMGAPKGNPFGQPDWGRKKPKPAEKLEKEQPSKTQK